MAIAPKINKTKSFIFKTCSKCGGTFGPENYAPSHSWFYADGTLPICDSCIDNMIQEQMDDQWQVVDQLCQMNNIPFLIADWINIYEMNPVGAFHRYSEIFLSKDYSDIDWKSYYDEYRQLRAAEKLDEVIPIVDQEKRKKLKKKWGENYDDEALDYLEDLFNGLLATQNINGNLQIDQALKICKMSYEIDSRIREGTDFDKLLSSYDKLVKQANFTPQNVKNLNDFDSIGELVKFCERKGWRNKFYDGVTRDVVDETIKNIQNFNQRLYTNEAGIGDQIGERIEALRSLHKLEHSENYYDTNKEHDLEKYDNEGYLSIIDSEEFDPDIGDSNV